MQINSVRALGIYDTASVAMIGGIHALDATETGCPQHKVAENLAGIG